MIDLCALRKDAQGIAAVEFALTIPIVLILMIGTMNFAIYFFAKSDVSHALDEAARYSAVYPTPSSTEITSKFNAKLSRKYDVGALNFSATPGNSGAISYVDLSATTSIGVEMVFFEVGSIPIKAERRVYVEG